MKNLDRTEIQDSIITKLPIPAHGILEISMRVGKGRITIEQIKREDCKSILWVTPSTTLRDKDVPEEFIKWGGEDYLKVTDIICYGSLHKHKGSYDKIILDELQHITEANSEPFFNGNITYNSILGLTGTMPKIQEKLDLISLLKLKTLHEITIEEAVDLDLVSDFKITMLETKLNATDKYIKGGTKAKPFMTTERATYSYLDKKCKYSFVTKNATLSKIFISKRMHFVYNLPSKVEATKKLLKSFKKGERTIIFAGSIESSKLIHNFTFNSKTDDTYLKAFKAEEIDTLVLVKSGGTGHTFKNVHNIIITQVDSNKSGLVSQKFGRGLLKNDDGSIVNIYIIYCNDTVDEKWALRAIEDRDNDKIDFYKFNEYIKI